ncbi:hypothetical protein [Nocardiopsis lucentensis]|uniref:hypothetical protein n=1 Tax=Nocardiopsis lucentensis TaxID=53441 RepID=UPI00034AA558|nr:hypothetical protein [Nocardiopsis lucentensis]
MTTLHADHLQETPTDTPTDATRHLCAGVYVDEKFRDLVLRRVSTTPYRRVAPSYGFDLVPVMRHAWWAAHLAALPRLMIVAAVIGPLLWRLTVASAVTVCGLVLLLLLRRALLLSAEITTSEEHMGGRRGRGGKRRRLSWEGWRWKEETRQLKRTGTYALLVAVTGVVVFGAAPGQGQIALAMLAVIALTVFTMGTASQLRVNLVHRAPHLRPRRMSARERRVAEQQGHGCVVYRRPKHNSEDADAIAPFSVFGEDSPFVGAGEAVYQWDPPMNVQMLRPSDDENEPLRRREHVHPPFRAHQLVERLRHAVEELRTDEPNVRLPVLVSDRVYAAENEVSNDRTILNPNGIDPRRMRAIIDGEDESGLHFIEVSVPSYGSELVTTVFLHVKLQGRTLTLFCVACALTRNPHDFQKVQEYGQSGKRAALEAGLRALIRLPHEVFDCRRLPYYPYLLARALVLRSDWTLRPIRNIGIGTRISAREEHAQEWRRVRFDQAKVLSHMKTVEERLLNTISDFLHEHDVDNSEFDKRAKKLVQNSFNIGSNTTIWGSALGHGSQAMNVNGEQSSGSTPPSNEGQQ